MYDCALIGFSALGDLNRNLFDGQPVLRTFNDGRISVNTDYTTLGRANQMQYVTRTITAEYIPPSAPVQIVNESVYESGARPVEATAIPVEATPVQSRVMTIVVPKGIAPGSKMNVRTPEGQVLMVSCVSW